MNIRRKLSRTATWVSSRWTRYRRGVAIGALLMVLIALVPVAGVLRHVHTDRHDLPDIEPFIHFELPTTGVVLDSRGEVLVELNRPGFIGDSVS